MLWYGIICLFVGGTLFSYAADGRSGFGSTVLTASVSATDWAMPVSSLTGFVPDTHGVTHVELDEPGQLEIAGSEMMEYTGGAYAPGEAAWACVDSTGQAQPYPCLIVRRNSPQPHEVGAHVYNENSAAINEFVGFRIGEQETPFGAIAFPFQLAGALADFIGKVVLWDYSFLEGNAVYFKWLICWPLSGMVIIAIIKLLVDASSIFNL